MTNKLYIIKLRTPQYISLNGLNRITNQNQRPPSGKNRIEYQFLGTQSLGASKYEDIKLNHLSGNLALQIYKVLLRQMNKHAIVRIILKTIKSPCTQSSDI